MLFLYFFILILISYFNFKFLSKINFFLENNINKSQAIQKNIVHRSGGLCLALIILIALFLYILLMI